MENPNVCMLLWALFALCTPASVEPIVYKSADTNKPIQANILVGHIYMVWIMYIKHDAKAIFTPH